MLTIASSQAKFILSGEHFVVDGAPSVVLPASCFSTQISLIDQADEKLSAACVFEGDQPEFNAKKTEFENVVVDLIKRAAEILNINLGGLQMSGVGLRCIVKSTIPPGQGAGSSSALCQAITEVMIKHFLADDVHPNYLKWFGTQLENAWHGPVSGIDNAAIAYQRILYYQRECAPIPLEPAYPLYFVVGSAGVRAKKSPYQGIRWYKDNQPLQYAAFKRLSSENATNMANAIRLGDVMQIGSLMNETHEVYNTLGLVNPKMMLAVQKARDLGAYGARMTGAGGGGFVIACVPVNILEYVQKAWMDMDMKSVRTLQYGNVIYG